MRYINLRLTYLLNETATQMIDSNRQGGIVETNYI